MRWQDASRKETLSRKQERPTPNAEMLRPAPPAPPPQGLELVLGAAGGAGAGAPPPAPAVVVVPTPAPAPTADWREVGVAQAAVAGQYAQVYAADAPGLRAVASAFRAVDAHLAEQGILWVVLIYPDLLPPVQEGRTYGEAYILGPVHERVRALLAGTSAVVLDGLDVLGPRPHSEVWDGTYHPGPSANRWIAEALAARIVETLGGAPAP